MGTSFVTWPGYTAYVPYRITVYTSSFTLEVIDAEAFRDNKEERKVWIGDSVTTSESQDFRDLINYLLIVSFEHFGENTARAIVKDISGDDARIKKLY